MSADEQIKGFFAYPSRPSISETIKNATARINENRVVFIKTWEDCKVGGKVIINEICRSIDEADLFCADLTTINLNVMFELGYAIAKEKRIWLVLDPTLDQGKKDFDQLRTLTTIGYAPYTNSDNIIREFYRDCPYHDLDNTLYKSAIQPNLPAARIRNIFYLKSLHENESGIRLTEFIQSTKISKSINDPKETGIQSLSWYGEKVYSSEGVICHLMNPERSGAWVHNARYALIAGMACGMGRNLLMLAEGDFLAPVDYRDFLKLYRNSSEAVAFLREWLTPIQKSFVDEETAKRDYQHKVKLVNDLKGVRLGEYVAESESNDLIDEDYFIETVAYKEALEGKSTLFVGRKGTGKTTNFYRLSEDLKRSSENLVCTVKPLAYELEAVVELFKQYSAKDQRGYVIESLWKYLLYTEIAVAIKKAIDTRQYESISEEEKDLLHLIDDPTLGIGEEFSVRLERCIATLRSLQAKPSEKNTIENLRSKISEGMHHEVLHRLRPAIMKAIVKKKRVCILIDNLDKPWTVGADLTFLSAFILGLISVLPRLVIDFHYKSGSKSSIDINLTVFLRSDIFHEVLKFAREPDKIQYSKIEWQDRELLLRVIEERFSKLNNQVPPGQLWEKFFCRSVAGIPVKEYMLSRILLRPRDIVYFVKAAISIAKNRNHSEVEEQDILDAEKQYSQYALDSMVVESITIPNLENILYEFAGRTVVVARNEVVEIVRNVLSNRDDVDQIINHLILLTFFGVEVQSGDFRFAEDPSELRKNLVMPPIKQEKFKLELALC